MKLFFRICLFIIIVTIFTGCKFDKTDDIIVSEITKSEYSEESIYTNELFFSIDLNIDNIIYLYAIAEGDYIEIKINDDVYLPLGMENDEYIKAKLDTCYINKLIDIVNIYLYKDGEIIQTTQYNNVLILNVMMEENLPTINEELINAENVWLCGENELTNIGLLTECINIKRLTVRENQIHDFSPLAGLKQIESLKLNVENAENINFLEHLSNLEVLTLSGLENTENMTAISNIKNLKRLDIIGYQGEDLVFLENLSELSELYLYGCCEIETDDLESINKLQKLKLLSLLNCNGVVSVFPIWDLESLEKLYISHCENFSSITGINSMTNLKELSLIECSKIKGLSTLDELEKLEKLELDSLSKVWDLDFVAELSNLKVLKIFSMSNVSEISKLENNTSIEECYLRNNDFLIEPLTKNDNLLKLYIQNPADANSYKYATNLKELSISCIDRTKLDMDGFELLQDLEELSIYSCTIADVAPFDNNIKLKKLIIKTEFNSLDFSSINNLKDLEYLDLTKEKTTCFVDKIDFLNGLSKLKHLEIKFSNQIDDYTPLSTLTSIEYMKLQNMSGDFPEGMKNLKNLITLSLYECEFQDSDAFEHLGEAKSLRKLGISEVILSSESGDEFFDVSFIGELSELKDLHLDCFSVKELPDFSNLVNLHNFSMYDARNIENVINILSTTNLMSLSIEDCYIGDLSFISDMEHLEELELYNCRVDDYSPILEMQRLKYLAIDLPNSSDVDLSFLNDAEGLVFVEK